MNNLIQTEFNLDPSFHWFEVNKLTTVAVASGEFGDVSNANGAKPVSLPNPIQPLYREWLEMRIGWMKDLFVPWRGRSEDRRATQGMRIGDKQDRGGWRHLCLWVGGLDWLLQHLYISIRSG